MGNRGPKIGQYATVGNERGIVIGQGYHALSRGGKTVHAPTVDISTPEGLMVDIPVRSLN